MSAPQIISLGIGSPASIAYFLLLGLSSKTGFLPGNRTVLQVRRSVIMDVDSPHGLAAKAAKPLEVRG